MATGMDLVRRDLREEARRKSRLLYAALQGLRDEGTELNLAEATFDLVSLLLVRWGVDAADEANQWRAFATVVSSVNLGLDWATQGNVEKAAAILSKGKLPIAFALGEKTLEEEVREPAEGLLKRVVFRLGIERRSFFGSLDPPDEEKIRRWANGDICDGHGLPPASREELEEVYLSFLRETETVIRIGEKVRWGAILGKGGVTGFATEWFKRPSREKPGNGGLIRPFLTTLACRAWIGFHRSIGESISSTRSAPPVELLFYLDPPILEELLERVMFEPEDLAEAMAKAEKDTRAFVSRGGLFLSPSAEEVEEILQAVGLYFSRFTSDVREFYFHYVAEPEAVQEVEVDRFWRSRLFVFTFKSSVSVRLREEQAVRDRAWELVPKVKSLGELAKILEGFHHWPEKNRAEVFPNVNVRGLLKDIRGEEALERASKALIGIWKILRGTSNEEIKDWIRFREKIDWSAISPALLFRLAAEASIVENQGWRAEVLFIAQFVAWKVDDLEKVEWDQDLFAVILPCVKGSLTKNDWKRLLRESSRFSAGKMGTVWVEMPKKERVENFFELDPFNTSILLRDLSAKQVEVLFAVLKYLRVQEGFSKRWDSWLFGHRRSIGFSLSALQNPSSPGEKAFGELVRGYGRSI
ncbi:hypothetical protein A2438_07240 [candidate division WOR-1 bacterium RIFOXYC2_FULL_46_14]|uniref:Uncharacterized protein n=1 Tax=candidate division WOR-1 bacterium RIFOXYC2_FULL_46_14 TaxID=1802587 RepID=A0A1F4U3T3_UNCSA|nr:MAG: hypothetical protein A2438_07240 [candidate division WOR-1 bacterium RIFOXYC2_FULL_46_14]HLD17952.1 hypothetical protein [Patescibacteria group bacterium]